MLNNNHFEIKTYSDNIAASLAQMWNESDAGWPGTFTRGVPMTEDRIVKWMKDTDYLLNLVVVRGDGKVVGYGNLRDTTNQTGVSCYVPLLNVHPQFQGKSLCRRMLNQMVDKATELGYQRMTIGTWSGNIKSVPLYKKVGFFWTPGTSVHMENYVPAARQLPFAKAFFDHVDWYQNFSRELAQVEDEMRHPMTCEMKVYTARWQKNDDFIEVVIDREGQSITGVETPQFAAFAVVDESHPAKGFRYGLHWHVENRQDKPVSFALKAAGEEGIDIQFETAFTLAAGEKRGVESSFVCNVDAPAIDLNETWEIMPRPHIQTQLTLGDETFSLATGLCYRPAVELSLEPETVTMLPGQEKTVLLQVQSRTKRPLSGTITLHPSDGITTDWESHPFEVDSEGFAAVPVTIRGVEAGGHILKLSASMPDGYATVETEAVETAVLCQPLGGIAAVQTNEKLIIENDFFQINAVKKGGRVKVWDKVSHKSHMFFREEVGPPYDPHDLEKRVYDLSLHKSNGQVTATFHIESGRFPGLHIKRDVVFTPSPLMQVTHTLENFNTEPVTCTLMLRLGLNDTDYGNGRSFIPTSQGLISEATSIYPVQTNDFPQQPTEVTEQWIAYEVDKQTHGVVWTEASKHKLRWGVIDLYPNEVTLNPGAHVTHAPTTIYCGNGSWEDVRRIWQRIAGHTDNVQPTPKTAYQLSLAPSPVIALSDQVKTTVTAKNGQKRALKGTLTLDLPAGWQADQTSFKIARLEQGQTFTEQITLSAPEKVAPAAAMLRMETPSTGINVPIPLLRLGDDRQSVQILEGVGTDGKPLLTMRNGRCTWLIAPQYHGGIVAWRDASEKNHLLTKYPDPYAHFAQFTPFHGGIIPTLINQEAGDWHGKLYDEDFTYQVIESVDAHQLRWQGVRVSAKLKRDLYKGLRVELEYVTLPGSNVLKAVFTVVNETAVYRTVHPELFAYCQVDGSYTNSEIVTADYHRKRVEEDYWEWHPSDYAAIVNPDTARCLVMVKASGRRELFLQDLGKFGGHMGASEQLTIPPHSSNKIATYLALTESLADAKQYAALAST